MKYLALLLLASCAALSPDQAARDRTYREIEQGQLTADEASQRDREIPIPWEELVLLSSALLGISVPASTALTNVIRDNARRRRGERVGRPVVRPTAQVEEIHEA